MLLQKGLAAVVVVVAGLGCLAAADKEAPASANAKVTIAEATWKETLAKVKAHKGKIVVLDAWSTSCQPCMKEFPNLVKLHEKHGKDVACMSLSCDYVGIKAKPPAFYKDKVLKFLTKQNASFENYLCTQAADEVYEEMGIASIPAVFVYGRDGKLLKRFDNDSIKTEDEAFTYEQITKLVEAELAR